MMLMHYLGARRTTVAVALLFILGSSSSAAANGPDKTAFSVTATGIYLVAPDASGQMYVVTCSGDPVKRDLVQYGTITAWRDDNGNILQLKIHAKEESEFYLESGLGNRLPGLVNYNVFTLTPGAGWFQGVEKWTGVFWHVVVPGVGTVFLDAGMEIVDFNRQNPLVRASGKHQWLDGDFEKLCAALR